MAETSARRIRAVNPDLSQSEKTSLDGDYAVNDTTLTVISNFGFQDNDYAVVGEPGTEKAEASDVTGTTANTKINISATLKFNHSSGTPVYRSEYSQVEFSKMTVAGGTWSVIATVGIKWDALETIYVDQGGVNSDSYRFRFKNAVSGNTSEYSPTITGAGFAKNQVGRMIANVRGAIRDPGRKMVSDDEIMLFLTQGKNIIRAKRRDWYFWEKEDEGTITTTVNVRKYDLDDISSRVDSIRDIRLRDTTVSPIERYQIEWIPRVQFDKLMEDESETSDDSINVYTVLPPDSDNESGYLLIDPKPATTGGGEFYIRFFEYDEDFSDVADTTSIPFPHILELYAISKCEEIKGNDSRARLYMNLFDPVEKVGNRNDRRKLTGVALLEQMQRDQNRPSSQPKSIRKFMGRRIVSRTYGRGNGGSSDSLMENWFDYGRGIR